MGRLIRVDMVVGLTFQSMADKHIGINISVYSGYTNPVDPV